MTVTDLQVSVPWYKALLGSDPVLDEDTGPFHHTVFALGGMLFGRLEEMGVPHSGIVDAHYGSGLSFRDPDNIALELFAPPAA